MREILFRGFHPCEDGDKTVYVEGKAAKGRWVYGSLIIFADGDTHICYPDAVETLTKVEVLHFTIGQYTGLTDKNGVKIFEGDIVSTDVARPYLIVEYRNGAFMVNCNDGGKDYHDILLYETEEPQTVYKYGEVIGNTHEEGRDERLD